MTGSGDTRLLRGECSTHRKDRDAPETALRLDFCFSSVQFVCLQSYLIRSSFVQRRPSSVDEPAFSTVIFGIGRPFSTDLLNRMPKSILPVPKVSSQVPKVSSNAWCGSCSGSLFTLVIVGLEIGRRGDSLSW